MSIEFHCGDSVEVLERLPGGFDVIVTSPPHFAARDYGVDGQWGVDADPQRQGYLLRKMLHHTASRTVERLRVAIQEHPKGNPFSLFLDHP